MNKEIEAKPVVYPQYISAYAAEDEISLIDIWISLYQFRKVFAVSFLGLLISGLLVVGLFKSDNYTMSTTIRIGQVEKSGSLRDLEAPSAVVSKLEQSFVPNLTRQMVAENDIDLFETDVSNPKDTSLVLIENKVKQKHENIFRELHQSIADAVLADHRELSNILNSGLEQKLKEERLALQKLENPRELVRRTDYERVLLDEERINLLKLTDTEYLNQHKARLRKRISIYGDKIANLTQQNQQLRSQLDSQKAGGAGAAQRALVLDKIAENQLSINEAEEMMLKVEGALADFLVEIDLKAERQKTLVESLESEIELIESNWKVEIEQKKARINELENELQGYNSRVTSLAEMSLEPVGLTKYVAYAITVVLALFGAFFILLVAMFREKVKEKLASEA